MPTPEDPNLINWALGLVSSLGAITFSWMHIDKRTLKKQVEDNTKSITKLESEMVTEMRVRELLDEGLLPIMKGINNIEQLLSQNTQGIAALDKKYEIDKAVRTERAKVLKEIEDNKK